MKRNPAIGIGAPLGGPALELSAATQKKTNVQRDAPPTIKTKHLTGRRIQQDDLEYVVETDSDIRIQRWLFGRVQTREESRERLDRWMQHWHDAGFGFWLFSDADNAIVGHGGLFRSPREQGEIEVGYVIKPDHWGHGFATEITRASLEVGFDLGLRRIIGIAQVGNLPSRRVMEKCGMVFEAEMPSFHYKYVGLKDSLDGSGHLAVRQSVSTARTQTVSTIVTTLTNPGFRSVSSSSISRVALAD